MSQKSKTTKKVEEEQLSIEEEIAEILDKKQLNGQTYYQVKYKSNNNKKQWRPFSQLQNIRSFQKQNIKFQLKTKSKQKVIQNHSKSQEKSQEIQQEKQPKDTQEKTPLPKKIRIDKEKIKNLINSNQQQSLNNFVTVNKIKSAIQEEKKESIKEEPKQSKPKIKTQTLKLSTSIKCQPPNQEAKQLKQTPKQQTKVNPVWLQKIKSINRVKGYELKNGQMFYDVEVLDNNGQNFFIPPLPSDIVSKFDAFKLAGFLQDCILRDYTQKNKTK